MKMLGGYLEFFMKPELAATYLSIKRELDELLQKKVCIWAPVAVCYIHLECLLSNVILVQQIVQ